MNLSTTAKFKKKNKTAVSEKVSGIPLIEIAVIVFFGFYYLLPSLSVELNFVISLFAALAYSVLVANSDRDIALFVGKLFLASLAISLLYLALVDTSTISIHASNYTLKRIMSKFNQMYMFFFPVVIYERISKKATFMQKRIITVIFIAIFGYVAFNTTNELLTNEDATRAWALFTELNGEDVGTYAYVYAVPIILTVVVSMIYLAKRGTVKLLLAIASFAMILFLIIAQYTLALLVAFVGIVLQINRNIKNLLPKIILWSVLLVSILFLPLVFDWLASVVSSSQMASRLREIADFFSSGDASGYNLSSRLTLYWRTIVAFFKSPIIGNRTLGFDGHATFLTIPADIGIIGAFLYFALVKNSKSKMDLYLADNKGQYFAAFVALALTGLTNPIHGALPPAFAIWVMAPLLINVWGVKNERKLEG